MTDLSHLLPGPVAELGGLFAAAGHQLVLVGGTSRDLLSGTTPGDLDCATDATPDQVAGVVADSRWACHPTGVDHGTVTVAADGVAVEVTTFRGDVYDGTTRRPTVTFTATFEEDAVRRDFTVNAIGIDVASGALLDPCGGLADLEIDLLRACGDPASRFIDDPLRIIRMVRFAATRGFGIDRDTLLAVGPARRHLDTVATERVTAELLKVIDHARPGAVGTAVRLAGDLGLTRTLLGGLSDVALSRPVPSGFGPDLAATLQGDRAGVLTCLASPLPADRRAATLAGRKLPSALVRTVTAACAVVDDLKAGRSDALSLRRAVRRDAAAVQAALVAGPFLSVDRTVLRRLADAVDGRDRWTAPLPIGGHDLIAAGLVPGRTFATALSAATDRWLAHPDTSREDLMQVALAAAS